MLDPTSLEAMKHESRYSVISNNTVHSTKSHQEYMDSLIPPTKEAMERIDAIQTHKEEGAIKRRSSVDEPNLSDRERTRAASLIQRNYRGFRETRMLEGMTLDPSTRWVEAIKEAEYRNATRPRPKLADGEKTEEAHGDGEQNGTEDMRRPSAARQNWRRLGVIARRAGGDGDTDDDTSGDENLPENEREAARRLRREERVKRQEAAKMMDLQYFLEMVDLKHRYGSNLRTYHAQWKKSDTKENFFYWLDYGEGRFIDCQGCPRETLDREQVRYLSKEERMNYLVKIDHEGRLCWAKNGARIDTTTSYKDSIHGIVPYDDDAPPFTPAKAEAAVDHHGRSSSESSSHSSMIDHTSVDEDARAQKYANPEIENSKGMKKVKHISAAAIFNKLLRKSVKKNTWIFVADTSFRLYVGIKASGAFQHSSFLSGNRISDAGLIKIKDGRLTKLSPLSGHYRPPVSNFRAFVHSLKDAGADMSHVSISRSYAVLVGLEAYVKTRRRGKKLVKKLADHRDKIISPDELAKREEAERDKSESAAREKRFLEIKQQAETRDENTAGMKLLSKLHIKPRTPQHADEFEKEDKREVDVEAPGTDPENAIAPEGTEILDLLFGMDALCL